MVLSNFIFLVLVQPLTGSDRDRPSDYQTTRTTAVPSDFAEQKKQQGDVGGFSGDYDLIEVEDSVI